MSFAMHRQKNPSIDGRTFAIREDTDSTVSSSSTTSSMVDEEDISYRQQQRQSYHYNNIDDVITNNTNQSTLNNGVLNEDGNEEQEPEQGTNINRGGSIDGFPKKLKRTLSRRPFSEVSNDTVAGGILPSNFNAVEYLINSLYNSLDSIELDRALVIQSQLSGKFNNTSNEILALLDEIKESLNEHIEKYERLKKVVIPEIVGNINKSTKLAHKLTQSMKESYPIEYSKSKDKVLNRISDDEENLYI
ncbi:unnamed protein product [Ambrosiozyma monospora]|uniref:Biogenesis of lysosome-related organelles complex 1 subunit KXD1 n=1 Tax=Ambrosiozyma monospora TaxID=43982 RepID=A0A9W7DBP6_AMBMO|nr:unnamed protein product [Ambrosiozyma monospora]